MKLHLTKSEETEHWLNLKLLFCFKKYLILLIRVKNKLLNTLL